MKMKIVWSILFPVSLLAVPLFVSAAIHTAGTNVLNNGTIYMVTTDGQLRPYTSAGAYLSYGFNSWNNVEQANTDDLALPVGNFIPPRDGKIVCSDRGTDKGTCYLITNGQKAGFTSEDVFNKSGFNFKYVLSGDVSFLPSTDNISSSTQTHLPGTLINDAGTVKLVGSTGTVGVPSMDTLKSWGYSLVDVVNANTADQALPQTDVLAPHTAGQLAYNTATNNSVSPAPTFNPTPTPSPTSIPTSTSTTPTFVVDVCKNIDGVQALIPAGRVADGNGNCIVNQQTTQPNPNPTSTSDLTPPSVPTGLTSINTTNSGTTLTWNLSYDSDSPVAGYKVFRNGIQIATTAVTSYQDTGLSGSTTYTYTVAAYDPSNNVSSQSSPYFVTTSPPTPQPSISITGGSGSLNINYGNSNQTFGTFNVTLSGEPITVQAMNFTITSTNPGPDNDSIGSMNLFITDPNGNTVGTASSTKNGATYFNITNLVLNNVTLSTNGVYKIVGAGWGGIGDTITLSTNPATDWSNAVGKTSGKSASLPNTTVNLGTGTFVGGGFNFTAQIPSNNAQTIPPSNNITFTNLQLVAGWNGNLGSDGYILISSIPLDLTVSGGGSSNNLSNCQLINGTTPINSGTNVINPTNGQNIFNLDQPLKLSGTVTLNLTCSAANNTPNGSTFTWGINPKDAWSPTNAKYTIALNFSSATSQPTTIANSGSVNNSVTLITNGYSNTIPVNGGFVKIAAIQFSQTSEQRVELWGIQYQIITQSNITPTLQLDYPDTNVQGTSANGVIAGTRGNNIIGTNFSGSQTQMYLYASATTAGSFVVDITGIQLADTSSGANIPLTGAPLTTVTITAQ